MSTTTSDWIPAWLQPAPDSLWRQMERHSANPRLHLLNLLWSLWIFATLFFTDGSTGFWLSVGVGYPLFVVTFALVHVRPFGEMRVYAGVMAMLALVSMFWNPSAWTYAVFACVYTGISTSYSPPTAMLRIAMIEAVVMALAWWLNWPWFVMLMAACVCTSSGIGAMYGYIGQMRNVQLRRSHDEVRRLAAATERERIGRDLHDLLGHTLSLITLKLELSRRLFDRDHDAARRELAEAEKVARTALAQVRAAVTGIRATDLAAELASARLLLQSSNVELECDDRVPDLPAGIERDLALLLREAMTNIVRHSRARHARLEVSIAGGNARLYVHDDGRGGATSGGNGLSGMHERVRDLGGVLRIDSPRGHGTTIEVLIPLPRPSTGAPLPATPAVAATDGKAGGPVFDRGVQGLPT